ncbi:MAG: hypothetical protein EXR95_05470 [Gemmatimonadetes bacterium]|nr:hypothetical protein [Gemmatimonadota bacterium]
MNLRRPRRPALSIPKHARPVVAPAVRAPRVRHATGDLIATCRKRLEPLPSDDRCRVGLPSRASVAHFTPSQGVRGITSFVVTKPTTDLETAGRIGFGHREDLGFVEGVRAWNKEDKMGWRASDTRELLLEDAFVPEENRLGEDGQGFVNFMRTLDAGRIGIAALSLGLAEGAFDVALRYTSEREQFGRKLREHQPVQFRLADLATDIEAGRHLTYHAVWLKERGEPFTKQAAMAKLFCSELAMRGTLQAIQLLGGAGYTSDYPVERMARDAKVCEIGEWTNEIQRIVIGRQLVREAFGD